MKIVYPNGRATKEEIAELLEFAMEGRRRVKERLKKMGSFEYYQTSFSYSDVETGEERFVGVPEQGGRNLISSDRPAPGTVYAGTVGADGTVGLYRVEVSVAAGSGKLRTAGGVSGATKESINRAFQLYARQEDRSSDRAGKGEIGLGFFVAAISALKKAPSMAALLLTGDLSVQGNIKGLRSLVEPLQVAMDNGARRALIPLENKRNFLEVAGEIMEHVDPIFFGDPKTAAFKALGLN
jgi:ATP-dependent Lon protease